jgi:hypothetical protein
MGVALCVVTEWPVDGLGPDELLLGPALARNTMRGVARQLGVRPLEEFHRCDPTEAAADYEELNGEPPPAPLPPEEWFSPEDGLTTVRRLLAHLGTTPDARAGDLAQVEGILERLVAEGVRWHLLWVP